MGLMGLVGHMKTVVWVLAWAVVLLLDVLLWVLCGENWRDLRRKSQ